MTNSNSDSINKVTLKGRLGKTPEIKEFGNGGSVANFSLATAEVYRDRNRQLQEKTDWHNIAVYAKAQVEACRRLQSGDLVQVDGKLETRSYDKDGQKHYRTEVCVRSDAAHSVQLAARAAPRPA